MLVEIDPKTGVAADWRPIETAPRDGTPILALMRDDFSDERQTAWNGLLVVLCHEGHTVSGFNRGWSVAAPVGYGGIPDNWLVGWQPLPLPSRVDPAVKVEAVAKAIHMADGTEGLIDWERLPQSQREGYLFVARAAIRAMGIEVPE